MGSSTAPGNTSPAPTATTTTVTTVTAAPATFAGHIPASDIAGLWCCMCWPFGAAIFVKSVVSDDEMLHSGCLLAPIPLPFCAESRLRHKGTNGFYKSGEPGNVDSYSSKSCAGNGPSCSLKLC
ncbi:hypothetical protein B484DRAFT_415454 [Ochromonadaceae sp. CCMP2298]|nr:hypothetical protein B484DRAFT_415454 [Ochromonadaceae sp. CCMP2298]